MNIHSTTKAPMIQTSIGWRAAPLFSLTLLACGPAALADDTIVLQRISRTAIIGDLYVGLSNRMDPKPHTSLMLFSIAAGIHDEEIVEMPLSWEAQLEASRTRCTRTALFMSRMVDLPTLKHTSLLAFPLEFIKRRIADPRLRESWDDVPHGASFDRCSVTPVSDALYGFVELTNEGYKRVVRSRNPKVTFDFQPVADTQIWLFMTIDGRLSKWFYDGKEWAHKRTYDLQIDGEFMVLEGGTVLVAVQDNRWCAFSGFEDGEAKVAPIAEVDDHEPMTVVDDVDAKRSFLHFKDTLYDAEGRAVQRIPAGLGSAEKVRELANAVRKHRPNERGK